MLEIFAHRALLDGIENSVKSISFYKKLGIGIELDIQYGKNGVYISHDPVENGDLFEDISKACSNSKIRMALHIKEIKATTEVIKLLKKYSISNYFLFNTENFEFSDIIDHEKIAAYLSQKQDKVKEKFLWCDEIQSKWYTKEIISELHKKNKILYGMSLEVVKTCNESEIFMEWKRLIDLGIDGICTKYPEKLMKFIKGDLN